MKTKLWILSGAILLVVALAVFIDIPQSPLWGTKIKAALGLDLVGGTELIYQADLSASTDKVKDLDNLKNVFEKRINELGVSEPSIQTSGGDRVIIDLPGIKDIDQAIQKIGATYELVFMTTSTAEDGGVQLPDYYDSSYTYPGYWKATDLTGRNLTKSLATFQNQTQGMTSSSPIVSIQFDNVGKQKFDTLTKENLNKQIAIVLDNKIVSAPTVQTEISDGQAIITGQKDIAESQELAKRLNEGMLPVPTKLIGQQNVGSTLGKDSLKASLIAGLIGLLIVAIFMISYYGFPGLIAVFALSIYAILTLAIYKIIPVTLTLAGIAGFILSIGMAIDANVLIFERMKEELKLGKQLNLSILDGFNRSWNSIRDSNISSIITCLILYFSTGSGPIRGFALTLLLGILISLFTAITVTRTILLLLASSPLKRFIHV
ncbi:MAG: protein translocase subunit SecD [Candidatus Berkelbacteria bacterium]|nr:protein translocase subunit SecD [Candidatus Berkelbacteria bacterium]